MTAVTRNPDAPFRCEHQNSGKRELEKSDTTPCIQGGAQLETAPRLVPRMSRGVCGVYDQEEEREREGKGESDGRPINAEIGEVHKVDVERDVDGAHEDEHARGRIHYP